jgi:hypothetical protein
LSLKLWKTPAQSAEKLVIGKGCAEVGGFFGPLLKKVRVVGLDDALPTLKIAPRTFARTVFEKTSVSRFGNSPRKFSAGFADAFDAFVGPFGVTVRPSETLNL